MKRSIAILGASVLALSLAACGGNAEPTKDNKSAEPMASSEGSDSNAGEKLDGELVVWGDETRGDLVNALGKKFEEKYGVKVKFVQKSNDNLSQDYTKQVPAGQGPDIIVTAHDKLGEWVKNGVVAPMDISNKKDKFLPVAVQGVTYDGQTYGVPYAIENIALIRNNKLTQAEPKTYDEMIEAGKASGAKFPFLIQSDPGGGDAYHMYPFQTSFGAPVFKSTDAGYTSDIGMAGDEGTAFAKWLKEEGAKGVLDVNISGDKAKEEFVGGNAAFIVTGPWNVPAFLDAKLDISVMPVPSAGGQPAAPFVGVQAFFSSPKTKQPLLVNKFLLEFVASEEGQKTAFDIGKRAVAWADASIMGDDKIIAGFTKAGEQGAPMPAIPAMGAVWEFWGSTEANIIQGKQDPTEGWNKMNENIKKAIDASK